MITILASAMVDVVAFRRVGNRIKPIPRSTTDKCSEHNPEIGPLFYKRSSYKKPLGKVHWNMVVQYTRTESDRLRYAPTRLAGSPMARDLENKRITRVTSLQRVGKVDGSSRSDTDGHDPSLRIPTRLAGSPMARDLENKRINRIMSPEGRKSRRIESIGHGWTRSVCDCVRLRETD